MKREIDLHQMSVIEAKRHLKTTINSLAREVDELDVIHGCHSGTALQVYVRKQFNHKRIEKKIIGMNQGVTTFMLNDSK